MLVSIEYTKEQCRRPAGLVRLTWIFELMVNMDD